MRVLLVTYHFPPSGEVGAIRPFEFARLLPEYGLEPWVLTVSSEYAEKLGGEDSRARISPDRVIQTAVDPSRRERLVAGIQRLRGRRRCPAKALSSGEIPVGGSTGAYDQKRLSANQWRALEWLSYPDFR